MLFLLLFKIGKDYNSVQVNILFLSNVIDKIINGLKFHKGPDKINYNK